MAPTATSAGQGAESRRPKPIEMAPLPIAYRSAARVRPTRSESQPPTNTPGTPSRRRSAAHWLAVADASVGDSPRRANAAARKAASQERTMNSSQEWPVYATIVRTSGAFRSTRRSRCARSPDFSGLPHAIGEREDDQDRGRVAEQIGGVDPPELSTRRVPLGA